MADIIKYSAALMYCEVIQLINKGIVNLNEIISTSS